jgi:hypothetical protein
MYDSASPVSTRKNAAAALRMSDQSIARRDYRAGRRGWPIPM